MCNLRSDLDIARVIISLDSKRFWWETVSLCVRSNGRSFSAANSVLDLSRVMVSASLFFPLGKMIGMGDCEDASFCQAKRGRLAFLLQAVQEE